MTSVFLSHSSIDKTVVRQLKSDLEASDVTVWLDEDQILPGESFVDKINHGLAANDYILLVISKNFLTSDWAIWETNTSIATAVKKKGIFIIPLLLEDVWDSVPAVLQDKSYVDFRKAGNVIEYRHSLGRLLAVLHGKKAPSLVRTRAPTIMVTGGRDSRQNGRAFKVAYEFGKLLGFRSQQMVCGSAEGVDEHFSKGATEALIELGKNPQDYLTCYFPKNRSPVHPYGQQVESALARREEGVPELIADSDIVVVFGGAKNTQYVGVVALLENKVLFPVAATGGAAKDLHSIILSRYERVFGNRLPLNKFRGLANVNASPSDLAAKCIELIDLC